MLQLDSVRKSYTTGGFTQQALDGVTIAFRDSEFVAILGPSGSGKTTLLNVVGGLDHADSGRLVIEGIDTSRYRDRDWDAYRNNRIGFVFQSYNLIPHQTVQANVELALTLSGVSRAERHRRAAAALERVGLAEHTHKHPSQLSGGQMQRVAIARALINDPEIVLADEPTGALDSTTSVQIMDLLTEIAQDRLVIMVTHNPELADQYATRIVNLRDGRIEADSNPFDPAAEPDAATSKPARHTSMSFLTAVALSFNNLMTKKGRTFMTAFAGSIGIIGIAAILSLANGVNNYIASIEEDTLSQYPLEIESQGLDMSSLLLAGSELEDNTETDTTEGQVRQVDMVSRLFTSVGSNDLAALKEYFDADGGQISTYANSIQYSYDVTPQLYLTLADGTARQVNPDSTFTSLGFGSTTASSSLLSAAMSTDIFYELMDDTSLVAEQYDVVAGNWPSGANEVVLVLGEGGILPDLAFYTMGLEDPAELDQMVRELAGGQTVQAPADTSETFSYQEIMDVTFTLVPSYQYYEYDSTFGVWTDRSSDTAFTQQLVADGETVHISGIVQPRDGATAAALQTGFYYTSDMVTHLIEQAAASDVVQQQLADPSLDVLTGRTFADEQANPENSQLDLSSLITVDEDAIKNAFTFDAGALTLDTSSLQLSIPDVQLDPSTLPELDLTHVLSGADLNLDLDMDAILASINLDNIDLGITADDAAAVAEQLATGYAAYCTAGNDCTDPEASFQAYLATSEGQQVVTDFEALVTTAEQGAASAQTELGQQVAAAVTAQVEQQVAAQSAQLQTALQSALSSYLDQAMAAISTQLQAQVAGALEQQITTNLQQAMAQVTANMSSAMNIDEDAFVDAFHFDMDEQELAQLLAATLTTAESSVDTNLSTLGYADTAQPSGISIYPKDFEAKGQIIQILDSYNERMSAAGEDTKVITYTDLVGTLMSSVTNIVNVVSYVLVAFVAISLVVSSIMIGVITYISVLERKKEIGVLRSIGASKRDVRRVFNAETLIEGFVAGMLGIGVTLLLTIPANAIVHARFNIVQVAILPWQAGVILVAISMGLTALAGLIPASAASRRDPVEALRSE